MPNIQKRTRDDGSTAYRVQIRIKGHPTETATFAKQADAKRWAQQTEAAIREGRHFKTVEAKRHTLADTIDRYISDVLPNKPRSQVDQLRQLTWWKEEIGVYLLSEVTPAIIVACRDKLAKGMTTRGGQRSPATVVRYMAALSHTFTIAVKDWQWLEDNPMRKVTKPKEARGRVRFLSTAERQRLLEACKQRNPALFPVVMLALTTGMRRGEIMGLTWEDVDLVTGRAILHETKNDERRKVPLSMQAIDALKAWGKVRRLDTDLVFPSPMYPDQPIDLRTPWETAVKHAELEDFHFHDLRHTAASYLAMSGATLAEIAEILGHKTLSSCVRQL